MHCATFAAAALLGLGAVLLTAVPALAEEVLRWLGSPHVDATGHRAVLLTGLALEVMHDPVAAVLAGEDVDALNLICHVRPSY